MWFPAHTVIRRLRLGHATPVPVLHPKTVLFGDERNLYDAVDLRGN